MFFYTSSHTDSVSYRLDRERISYNAARARYEQSRSEKMRILKELDVTEMKNVFSNNNLLIQDKLKIFIKGLTHGINYSSTVLKWLGLNHKDELFCLISNSNDIGLAQTEVLNMLQNSLKTGENKQPISQLGVIWNVQRGLFSCRSGSGTLRKVENYIEARGLFL